MTSVGKLVVAVTGGCGYVGSQVLRDLVWRCGDRIDTIRIIDNLYSGSISALMDLPREGKYEFIEGDILDPSALRMALTDVDAVIHLAAIVRTPLRFENPFWLEQVNRWGTVQVVEAALKARVRHLVLASSTSVYGPGGPYRETDECHPQGAYAQSKLNAEHVVLTARERGLGVTILRLGVVYGRAPVTRFDAVANRFAYMAGTRGVVPVHGNGAQRRSFVHIRDAAAAVAHALFLPAQAENPIFNVVGTTCSIFDLAETVHSLCPATRIHYSDQDILTHYSFESDNARLVATGWQPEVAIAEGMADLLGHFVSCSGIALSLPPDCVPGPHQDSARAVG